MAAVATTLGGGFALAQPEPSPERGPRPGPGGLPPGGRPLAGMARPGFAPALFERVLTEEQRRSFREALDGQRDETRKLEEQLRDARKALFEASLARKLDENVVREKALKVGKLEAELTVLRARAMSKIEPPLSAEQLEQLKNPPPPDLTERPVGRSPERDRPRDRERRGERPPPREER
jgi:Spy/CpxP family protein refolding chaperone